MFESKINNDPPLTYFEAKKVIDSIQGRHFYAYLFGIYVCHLERILHKIGYNDHLCVENDFDSHL